MQFKIDIDYKRKPEDVKATPNVELTLDYFSFAVRNYYKDGLDSQFRRLWGRIQRKLDTAIDAKAKKVDLDMSEIDFLKTAIKNTKFSSDLAKYVIVLEDELDKSEEVEENAPKSKSKK